MEVMFYLVVTFWSVVGQGVAMDSSVVPTLYTFETCRAAGAAAAINFAGGAKVEWTCVPVGVSP